MLTAAKKIVGIGLLLVAWEAITIVSKIPAYILPPPSDIAIEFIENAPLLIQHMAVTALEVGVGFAVGGVIGLLCALAMIRFELARNTLQPMILVTQAVPVFAIAPLLTLWLGFGLSSKIAITTLIIFFPISACFYDGLRRTPTIWLDLAHIMQASPWRILVMIRIPAALPALASGLKMAAVFAPIGAVVGEWVGASQGLGYLMLYANGRVKTDLMFASLILLAFLALLSHALASLLARRMTRWQPESDL